MSSRRLIRKSVHKKPVRRARVAAKKRHVAQKITRSKTSRRPVVKRRAVRITKTTKIVKKRLSPHAARKLVEDAEALETAAKAVGKTREIFSEGVFRDYLLKTVGAGAGVIVNELLESPCADEKLSETLKIKPNEARRILNVLNSYGIVRYNINKDSNGWLTFVWYIDHDSVITVRDQLQKSIEAKRALPEDCNDYFACSACSSKHASVLPFTDAFEATFKCSCGRSLKRVSREEAESIYNTPAG